MNPALIGWSVLVIVGAATVFFFMRIRSRHHRSETKLSKDVEVDIIGNSDRPSSNDFAQRGHRRVASSLRLHELDLRPQGR